MKNFFSSRGTKRPFWKPLVKSIPQACILVLNQNEGQPFEQTIPGYGTVYHVGNAEDVLKLLQNENGLAWTAHLE